MKIVFHVPELARTQACLNNLHNYLNSGEVTLSDELLVIFNGDAVKALYQSEASAKNWLQLANNNSNLTLQVCNNSLQGLNIKPENLIANTQIIPSAIVELIKLQKQGCIYLRP